VRDSEQMMYKLRLRRLIEELLDADLLQVDYEESEEEPGTATRQPTKRLNLVARYIPA
jgi:hypothetical protein